jgi:hypothetical protein
LGTELRGSALGAVIGGPDAATTVGGDPVGGRRLIFPHG